MFAALRSATDTSASGFALRAPKVQLEDVDRFGKLVSVSYYGRPSTVKGTTAPASLRKSRRCPFDGCEESPGRCAPDGQMLELSWKQYIAVQVDVNHDI